MRSIDALAPREETDTSKKIVINDNMNTNAIGELNVNLKEIAESTKESIEKITTDFQNTIKEMVKKDTTETKTEPKEIMSNEYSKSDF